MPTKIVSDQSNPAAGKISQHDLYRIMEDFQNLVQIQSSKARQVIKTEGINIPFWILKKLMDDSFAADGDDYKYVNIHFAVSLPNQKSCADEFKTDISNYLTAVVNIGKKVNKVMVERININDEIITLGFKPKELEVRPLDDCCGHPKGS